MLAAWLLRRREYALSALLPYLVSVATGLLLATALLHLLPEAIASLGNTPRVWYLLTGGILGLFCIEQIVAAIVHTEDTDAAVVHVHAHGHAHHTLRPASLIVASSLHSFLDGVSVAAAFAAGPRVGWITALAISLHEVPHRVGDFAVLLHAGYTAASAFRMAVLPSLGALLGVALVAAVRGKRRHGCLLAAAHQRGKFSLYRLRKSAAGIASPAQPRSSHTADAVSPGRSRAGGAGCRIARRIARPLSFHSRKQSSAARYTCAATRNACR